MMKKLFMIMNPCSGKRLANKHLTEIIGVFNRGGYEVSVYMTEARKDATRVAAEAAGYDMIVCVGGDGSFNEVISGTYPAGLNIPIGYIPAGSTNDFAGSLKLSRDPVQAARDITEGRIRPLDIGQFNDRYFSYIASFGAFTKTSYATSQSLKNALGHMAYLLSGIKEFASIRSHHLKITLAAGTVYEDDYIFGAISNSTSVAGLFTLPETLVDMSDGLFELLLVRKPHNPVELAGCVKALKTQNYNTPMLTVATSARIEVEAPEDMDWTLDGEHCPGAAHCIAENLHHAIHIVVK